MGLRRMVEATGGPEGDAAEVTKTVSPARRSVNRIASPFNPVQRVLSVTRMVSVVSVGRLTTIVPLSASTEETMKNSSPAAAGADAETIAAATTSRSAVPRALMPCSPFRRRRPSRDGCLSGGLAGRSHHPGDDRLARLQVALE